MTLLDDIKDFHPSKWTSKVHLPDIGRRVQALAPKARQFVFDEAASEFLGRFIRECPDVLIDQMQFALQPYETTYIELNLPAVFRGTGRPHTGQFVPNADQQAGFLAHGGIVYTLANNKLHPQAALSTICILDNEYADQPVDTYIDDSRVLLGTTWYDLDEAQREAFSHRFNVGYIGLPEVRDKVLEVMIPATMGEARVYLAALLLLFNRRRFTVTDHDYSRRGHRGKIRTFMAYSSVTIHLDQWRDFRFQMDKERDRLSPRRHEVRAHYKHRHLTPGCEHQWQQVEEKKQWRCTRCSGLRYLCREHLRGDAGIGFVKKDYQITL